MAMHEEKIRAMADVLLPDNPTYAKIESVADTIIMALKSQGRCKLATGVSC